MSSNSKEDEDCLFLERVLDKLYDFGNSPAAKKKSQKKKKRKRCEEEEEEEFPAIKNISSDTEDSSADQQQQHQPKTKQTGPSVEQASQVKVVIFQDPRKKQKTKQTAAPDRVPAPPIAEKEQSNQLEELSLEKARLEVHRFGITGYKKEQQRVFEQDRAVMLGARLPKKEYVNYKILQQQIKEKKEKDREEVQPELKNKKKKVNNQREKKKPSSASGTAPTGQVGRFKNGMLILSSKEIQKIKGIKRGK